MCLLTDSGGWVTAALSAAAQMMVQGGTDPEDIALAPCLLGLLCRDSPPFSVTFIGDSTCKAAVSSRILFFFFRTTPPLCSAGLCAATWEISLLVKSWAALFLSEVRFKDSPSTDEEKKRWKQPVCMWCGLNISTSCEGVRWRRSIKEQRGSRFVSQRYEKSDGISLPFAPPTLLRIWRHKRARGCRDSSLLFSLRVLFWQGRRKGGWLAYLHIPLFFTLFGKRLEKTPIIYVN